MGEVEEVDEVAEGGAVVDAGVDAWGGFGLEQGGVGFFDVGGDEFGRFFHGLGGPVGVLLEEEGVAFFEVVEGLGEVEDVDAGGAELVVEGELVWVAEGFVGGFVEEVLVVEHGLDGEGDEEEGDAAGFEVGGELEDEFAGGFEFAEGGVLHDGEGLFFDGAPAVEGGEFGAVEEPAVVAGVDFQVAFAGPGGEGVLGLAADGFGVGEVGEGAFDAEEVFVEGGAGFGVVAEEADDGGGGELAGGGFVEEVAEGREGDGEEEEGAQHDGGAAAHAVVGEVLFVFEGVAHGGVRTGSRGRGCGRGRT